MGNAAKHNYQQPGHCSLDTAVHVCVQMMEG
eukprot:COSAG02_NODE_68191_length_251_cov_0.677632_1_plen_30_part_10